MYTKEEEVNIGIDFAVAAAAPDPRRRRLACPAPVRAVALDLIAGFTLAVRCNRGRPYAIFNVIQTRSSG